MGRNLHRERWQFVEEYVLGLRREVTQYRDHVTMWKGQSAARR